VYATTGPIRQTAAVHGYGPASYGDAFADVYDDWYADVTDVEACTRRVVALARALISDRPAVVLELGVGTGRLAVPLRDAGLDVRGIDASQAMVDRLHHKASDIPVVVGDFSDPVVPRRDGETTAPSADVVLCAYNTLFNLTDGHDQQRCLDGVASLLTPGGALVVEAFVPPDADDPPSDDVVRVRSLHTDAVVLSASVVRPDQQRMEGQFIEIRTDGIRLRPWALRYRSPTQLDEMARTAGLRLEERCSTWDGDDFTSTSPTHISIYRRQDTPT